MRRYESREARFSSRVLLNYVASSLPETLSVVAATGNVPVEILLYDEIGFWGVTAKDFVLALAQAGDGPIILRINSPGGDVFDGLAIYNALRARKAPVNVVIDGLAASAASFIAMAGTTLSMAEQSMMMIHNAFGLVIGDRNDMLEMAAVMEKIDGQLAEIYSKKSGKPLAELRAMQDAETWFTASEAKAAGFCDGIVSPPTQTAKNATQITNRVRSLAQKVQAQLPDYDPDGDGDNDAEEALGMVNAAMVLLGEAVDSLTGAPDADDAGEGADDPSIPGNQPIVPGAQADTDAAVRLAAMKRRFRLAEAA